MNSTATFDGVLRRTGCRELFAGEKKRRKQQRISRDREREKGREQTKGLKEGGEGLPEASARERLFTILI